MNLLQLSWKNLLHKPLNMALSLILFALGVGLISLLLNLNRQLEDNFNKNLAGIDLVIGAKGSPLQLILCSMYHVDNPTGNIPIEKTRPFLNPQHPLIGLAVPLSLGDSYKGFRIAGTTYEILQLYQAELDQGKLWEENMEVTLGASVARKHHLHIGDTFKSSHGLVEGFDEHEHDFKVVGILKPTGSVIDQLILTSSQSIWEVHAHAADKGQPAAGSEGDTTPSATHEHKHHEHSHEKIAPAQQVQNAGFKIPSEFSTASLMDFPEEEITSILIKFRNRMNYQAQNMGRNINENTDLQAANPPVEIARLQTNLGVGARVLNKLAWVIVVVSGLSIFISLFSSLKERKYELALMRVMGGTRRTLFVLIIFEGLLLAVFGYLLGLLFSHTGLAILADLMQDAYRYSFSALRFLKEEVWLLGGALLVGFFAALIPALQARKTDISETLAKG